MISRLGSDLFLKRWIHEAHQCPLRFIGHLPQHIFLADDTVAADIAFGVSHKRIDMDAVKRAARLSELESLCFRDLAATKWTVAIMLMSGITQGGST